MTPQRIARLRQVLEQRQPDLTVVTDFVHKQRNLSAIVRVCDAVGIGKIYPVLGDEDYTAFRGTAMGSHNWVEVCPRRSVVQALTPLAQQGYQLVGAHPGPDSVDFRELDYTVPTAVVLGAERRGLSAQGRALVQPVAIPMSGMIASLNVSVAAGIILSEVQRQRQVAGLYSTRRIEQDLYDRLFFEWGHPQVAQFCRERKLRYPALNSEGEIDQPSQWYARVRAGTAQPWKGHTDE